MDEKHGGLNMRETHADSSLCVKGRASCRVRSETALYACLGIGQFVQLASKALPGE